MNCTVVYATILWRRPGTCTPQGAHGQGIDRFALYLPGGGVNGSHGVMGAGETVLPATQPGPASPGPPHGKKG